MSLSIEQLQALRTTRLQGENLAGLSKEINRARIDCLIYFYTVQFGWGPTRRHISKAGKPVQTAYDPPVSHVRRLAYPSRGPIQRAGTRIRKACPEETEAYELAFTRYKECRRRYLASETEEGWAEYRKRLEFIRMMANKQRRAEQDLSRTRRGQRTGAKAYFINGFYRYQTSELLEREAEHERAWNELGQAVEDMKQCRLSIFEKMGVPEQFRVLA